MKSRGQIGYEAFCKCIKWLRPEIREWLELSTSEKDAWEAAGDAVAIKTQDQYESKIEALEIRVEEHKKAMDQMMEKLGLKVNEIITEITEVMERKKN